MRPKLKISLKPLDVVLEVVTLAVFAFLLIYIFISWPNISDKVPTHFNFSGQADAYGSKNSLLVLFPIIILLYAALTILQSFPHIYNYIVEINEKNALVQYTYAVRLFRFLKLIVVIIFSYIEFQSLKAALSPGISLSIWFLPITLVLLFGTIGCYIKLSLKNK